MGTSLCRARSESSILITDTSSGTRILRSSSIRISWNAIWSLYARRAVHSSTRLRSQVPAIRQLLRFVRVNPHQSGIRHRKPCFLHGTQISQITLSALSVVQFQDCPIFDVPSQSDISQPYTLCPHHSMIHVVPPAPDNRC